MLPFPSSPPVGIDDSDITARSKPKQISAAKSFSATCTTFQDACSWLRMLCAEVDGRAAEDVALFSRVPSTLVLHYSREGSGAGRSAQWHSKSAQLHRSATGVFSQAVELLRAACVDEGFTLAKVAPVAATTPGSSAAAGGASDEAVPEVRWSGAMFPCTHLSIALSGFNDVGAGMAGSARAMQAFLAAKPLASACADGAPFPASSAGGSAAESGSGPSSVVGVGQKRSRGPTARPVSIIAALQHQSALAAAAAAQRAVVSTSDVETTAIARTAGAASADMAKHRHTAPSRQADLGLMFRRVSAVPQHPPAHAAAGGPPMLPSRSSEVVDLVSSESGDDGNA